MSGLDRSVQPTQRSGRRGPTSQALVGASIPATSNTVITTHLLCLADPPPDKRRLPPAPLPGSRRGQAGGCARGAGGRLRCWQRAACSPTCGGGSSSSSSSSSSPSPTTTAAQRPSPKQPKVGDSVRVRTPETTLVRHGAARDLFPDARLRVLLAPGDAASQGAQVAVRNDGSRCARRQLRHESDVGLRTSTGEFAEPGFAPRGPVRNLRDRPSLKG